MDIGFQDLIALGIAIVAAGFAVRFIWRSLSGSSACACSGRPCQPKSQKTPPCTGNSSQDVFVSVDTLMSDGPQQQQPKST